MRPLGWLLVVHLTAVTYLESGAAASGRVGAVVDIRRIDSGVAFLGPTRTVHCTGSRLPGAEIGWSDR